MAAWLFMICIEMIFALININVLAMYSFQFITFTYGPLMYLYVRFMTNPAQKFKWLYLLHFIPFIAFFAASVIFRSEPFVRDLRGFFRPDKLISLRIIYGTCFFVSITIYSILSFIEIGKHQKNMKNLVAYTSGVITLNWLKIVTVSFYISYFILFILGGLNIIGNYIPFDPYFVIFGFITLFSFVFSFYAIQQDVILGKELRSSVEEPRESEKYSRSGLKDKQADEYLSNLLSYMEKNKPFLDRDLSIYDLSKQTGIPRHYITQILNEKHGKNFFMFVNEYRIREVILRFEDQKYRNFTILAIALDSGFNSKATFNSIFKNQTGITPSAYREKLLDSKK